MDDWLKLLTWVVMDGTIVHKSSFNKRVQFKLSKQRKIQSLQELLNRLNFKYTFREAIKGGINKLQPYYICLYGDEARLVCAALGTLKKFPETWKELSQGQAASIIDTIAETDGSRYHNKISWISTDEDNIKVIRDLCDNLHISFKVKENANKSGFKNGKPQFRATIY